MTVLLKQMLLWWSVSPGANAPSVEIHPCVLARWKDPRDFSNSRMDFVAGRSHLTRSTASLPNVVMLQRPRQCSNASFSHHIITPSKYPGLSLVSKSLARLRESWTDIPCCVPWPNVTITRVKKRPVRAGTISNPRDISKSIRTYQLVSKISVKVEVCHRPHFHSFSNWDCTNKNEERKVDCASILLRTCTS